MGTGGWWTKKNLLPPSFVVGSCLLLGSGSWHNVHRHSGGHSAKLGWLGGGIDRGHVGGYCKPNWGDLVWRITFCLCFAPPGPLFFGVLADIRECCERRTLATQSNTAQIFAGVNPTC